MLKRYLLFLLFVAGTLGAQQWVISDFDIEVDGATQKSALLRVSGLSIGQIFENEESLLNALAISKNNFDDSRLFEQSQLTYRVDSKTENIIFVTIEMKIVDTWNLIALPYPKYDSNSGFSLSLRVRNYNFLGSMEPLKVNFDYSYNELEQHEFGISGSYVYNFLLNDQNYYVSLTQGATFNEEDSYGDEFYLDSALTVGTKYILPWDIYEGNKISYSPKLKVSKDYSFEGISDQRNEITLTFSHSFNLGQASWGQNNYREGLYYSLENSWDYDFDNPARDVVDAWSSDIHAKAMFHKDLYPLGYSARVGMKQNLDDNQSGQGGVFRGILTDDVESRGMIYMNNALYITVWNDPDIWEIMGGPVLDVGYMWDIPEGQDSIAWSVAVEGLCFPAMAKSFQARITIGFSGNGIMESDESGASRLTDNMELFFGLGKFF